MPLAQLRSRGRAAGYAVQSMFDFVNMLNSSVR